MADIDEEKTLLPSLPDECLTVVASILPLASVASLIATASRFLTVESDEMVWRAHLCNQLNLPEDRVSTSHSFHSLLQHAQLPRQTELLTSSESAHLTIEAFTASFHGKLGRDRAVRADQPLPDWQPPPVQSPFVAVRTTRPPARTAEVVEADDEASRRYELELTNVYYFEVQITSRVAGANNENYHHASRPPCVSVGLATSDFNLRTKQAGWTSTSIGYHGDDGYIYHGSG